MNPITKVGIIGPQDSIDDCLEFSGDFPQLDLKGFPYESEADAPEIVKEVADQCDVLLFTGPVPYSKAKDLPEMQEKPSLYIPFNGSSLFRSLFQIRFQGDLTRITVDFISRQDVEAAFHELGIAKTPPHVLEYEPQLSKQDIVEFHKRHYESGESLCALTPIRSCYYELVRLGIPAIRIYPLKSVIRETMVKACLIGESVKNKGNQVAVGIIAVDNYSAWSGEKNMHEIQQTNLQLTQSIISFCKEIDGHYLNTVPGEYLFFTTRGLIEKATNGLKRRPNLKVWNGLTLSVGIGLGGSTHIAADFAKIGVNKAKEIGGNSCFVVNENHQLIGPIGQEDLESIDLRTTDEHTLEVSKKTGLSPLSLNRIFQAIDQVGEEFTANEMAPYLGMTVRSARRLLRQLEQAATIEVVGQESLQSRGKPRRVYRLTERR